MKLAYTFKLWTRGKGHPNVIGFNGAIRMRIPKT